MNLYLFNVVKDGRHFEVEVLAESQQQAEQLLSPLHNVMFVAEGDSAPDGTTFNYTMHYPQHIH
jgi:hypothetical protein